ISNDMGPGDHPLLGKRIPPDLRLTLTDGTRPRIADLLHTARGLLITTDQTDQPHPWADRIDTITATEPPAPGLDTALIRPDGYIAWTRPGTDHDLTHALTHWFGTARAMATAHETGR
ncbi:monooxygenase, partial [Actinomadura sp. 7K534]